MYFVDHGNQEERMIGEKQDGEGEQKAHERLNKRDQNKLKRVQTGR
jgi:hypothetical protein